MDTLETIATRRSVRRFTQEPVADDAVRQILTAGMSGPSAGDQRPWQFFVLSSRERLDALAAVPAYERTLGAAPLAIVVCADMELSKYGENWIIDCAIATQNILRPLTPWDWSRLAQLLLHGRPAVGGKRILGVPDHVIPFAVVPIGVPAKQPVPVDRYAADRVHVNAW